MKKGLIPPDRQNSASLFFSDLHIEGMYYASTVRSPVFRGTLISITPPSLPRGYSIIRGQDISGAHSVSTFGSETPILNTDKIKYRGEPVALIVGPDRSLTDELAEAVVVQCEEELPVFAWETFSSSQVIAKKVVSVGEPDQAFGSAARIVSGRYKTGSGEHYYSETMGALAFFDYDKMAVYCATQWPFHVRDSVAKSLACMKEDVVVYPTRLGVHLDGKIWYPTIIACQAALASHLTGKPVCIQYTREEDFLYTPKRTSTSVSIDTALDSKGTILGSLIHLSINVGAYAPLANEILSQAMLAAAGIYACPNVRIEGYAVRTNTPPLGALGGTGPSQAFFATEAHSQRIAFLTGEEPGALKLRTLARPETGFLGTSISSYLLPCETIVSRLRASSDFTRKYASFETIRKSGVEEPDLPLRGIGMAMAYQNGVFSLRESGSPASIYAVEGILDKNLIFELKTSAAAAGSETIDFCLRDAAALLDLPLENIKFKNPSTNQVPDFGPGTTARGAILQKLVTRCCRLIQKRRFRDPLPIAVRCQHRPAASFEWQSGKLSRSPFDSASWGGAVVEVALHPRTYEIEITGIWLTLEGSFGPIDHDYEFRRRAEGIIRSNTIEVISSCIGEKLDPASLTLDTYHQYRMISALDIPRISVDFFEPRKRSIIRNYEELPFTTIPGAFLSAISQASGLELGTIPVYPDDFIQSREES